MTMSERDDREYRQRRYPRDHSEYRPQYNNRGGYSRSWRSEDRGYSRYEDRRREYPKRGPRRGGEGHRREERPPIEHKPENHWVTRLHLQGKMKEEMQKQFEELDRINDELSAESVKKLEAEMEVSKYNRLLENEKLKRELAEERLREMNLD